MISFAASIPVKATVTTALALCGARLARNSRAAVRHVLRQVSVLDPDGARAAFWLDPHRRHPLMESRQTVDSGSGALLSRSRRRVTMRLVP
jgi:hypothetical protein